MAGEEAFKKGVSQIARRVLITAFALEKGDHGRVVGGTEFAQRRLRFRVISTGALHQRPSGGGKGRGAGAHEECGRDCRTSLPVTALMSTACSGVPLRMI